jgi:hypothetical protein
MARRLDARTRQLTVIAQDPSIRSGGRILTTLLQVPMERLAPGPTGHRVQVIDFDASTGVHYKPLAEPLDKDPFAGASDDVLLGDPHFHCQNVYAIAMSTLGRFEAALGRRVAWSFGGHQLKIAPHAFADANAFYSEQDQALMFGYFPGRAGVVHTCLSHDVVAHETTHAVLDGLRTRYTDLSSPDQAAFHEGFADLVAILGGFAQPAVFSFALADFTVPATRQELFELLRSSLLLRIGEQFGEELSRVRGEPLRKSLELPLSKELLGTEEFEEPHRRGEVLVAAMLTAMLRVWVARATDGAGDDLSGVDVQRVRDEGPKAAAHLLVASIRALDYAPPVDLQFSDYLSALLTADAELWPDDGTYHYRNLLRAAFAEFGIKPASQWATGERGAWAPPPNKLTYANLHLEALQRDPDEVFRFLWENRAALELREGVFTRVLSVRPCVRVASDGFILRETVADYIQVMDVRGSELAGIGIEKPKRVRDGDQVTLYGGGAVILDEFGKLKYHVYNHVDSERQSARLDYLARSGELQPRPEARRFASMHRNRMMGRTRASAGGW